MKTPLLAVALVVGAIASPAFADIPAGKTRAQVYEELVEAQGNGLQHITNTSYPDVARIYAPWVAKMAAGGGDAKGLEEARAVTGEAQLVSCADTAAPDAAGAFSRVRRESDCVGPASFCSYYFGS